MATLILGAGLSALGGSLFTAGTTAALLASSALGSAGALIGGVIDRRLFGPGDQFIRQPTLEGPRVDRLTIMQSTYGAPLPAVKGWERIAGNVIWSQGLEEERIEHTETQTQETGGKGGGGASTTTQQTTIEYAYFATFAVGICQGPIAGVGRIWGDTKIVYDVLSDQGAVDWTARQPITVYPGALDQDRDPVMASWLGTTNTPAYRGVAYAVFNRFPLARFGNRIPNLTFEVLV